MRYVIDPFFGRNKDGTPRQLTEQELSGHEANDAFLDFSRDHHQHLQDAEFSDAGGLELSDAEKRQYSMERKEKEEVKRKKMFAKAGIEFGAPR